VIRQNKRRKGIENNLPKNLLII